MIMKIITASLFLYFTFTLSYWLPWYFIGYRPTKKKYLGEWVINYKTGEIGKCIDVAYAKNNDFLLVEIPTDDQRLCFNNRKWMEKQNVKLTYQKNFEYE